MSAAPQEQKPSPLVGEGRAGGREVASATSTQAAHGPTPAPPHKGEGKEKTCSAELVGTVRQCLRCALAWDDGDMAPACEPLTYPRLAAAALAEAALLEEAASLSTRGDPNDPDPLKRPVCRFRDQAALKRAMEMRALARMVGRAKGAGI
jgi:hypothetical protein